LRDEADQGLGQYVWTGAGSEIWMDEIEHVDASGNLYGFLDDVDVALGGNGMKVNGENVGIGSSAQLHIIGSVANNILIGGFDNDRIEGREGNDLLMGGNLNYLNNPNMLNIPDNGMDELYGGRGDDHIVFEADGGIIDGSSEEERSWDGGDYGDDTLWVTREALGNRTAVDVLADGVLRFELQNGDWGNDGLDIFAGYGGADVEGTSDQTNYINGSLRVTINGMENVIATGLGAVDYLAAGTNNPELVFNNQQNHYGYDGDLDLRGTDGSNILYANTGNDVIEGREGNDFLSGGEGNDDFIFQLTGNHSGDYWQQGASSGDGVNVIWRQADLDGDNIWDGFYVQDFGTKGEQVTSNSMLTLTLVDNADPATLEAFPVNGISFTLGGVSYLVQSDAMANTTYAGFVAELNAALDANPDLVDLDAVLNADNTITITDPAGGIFEALGYTWLNNITPPAGNLEWDMAVGAPTVQQDEDRLIFKSYMDRSDNEGVHDDGVTGSTISLGMDGYAQDLVVGFAADGTRIAEDQYYEIYFNNLMTNDVVKININGVIYQLQVGVSIDGTNVDAEDGLFDTPAQIQASFLSRMKEFINSFMDDDTAAGSVGADTWGGNVLAVWQNSYAGEETVFMHEPTVELSNLSGGERPTASVYNYSDTEVWLYDYDGRNNNDERLTAENVLFVGETGISRAVLATALEAGGTLLGSDALVINGGVDDLIGIAHNLATGSSLNDNFAVHGDDYLIGGNGNDIILAGTGDDRVRGSLGNDVVDGGKDLYAVRTLGQTQYAVETLNAYEAELRDADPSVLDIYLIEQTEDGHNMIDGDKFVPYFNDTLIFHQADFAAGVTEFTINLNKYLVGTNRIILNEGGAGTVQVDVDGDGDFEAITTFTNFENIRTVSGVGRAVAGDGQGNDTLILTGLSNDTDGVEYYLTNGSNAGLVTAWWQDWTDTDGDGLPDDGEIDWYGQDIIYVDGVENVIGGSGDDWLNIDQTEAAKNNFFDGKGNTLLGDGIGYYNDFGSWAVEPTVTIVVEAASDTDQVIMTGGRVGQTVATDTLKSVEYIGLYENTAAGILENDVLDVTNVSTDVLIDIVNLPLMAATSSWGILGTVSTDRNGDGDFTDPNELLLVIENMFQLENFLTDANDTVLVADADFMSMNDRSDSWSQRKELVIDTYLNYDSLNPNTLARETVAVMRANGEAYNDIPEARNFGQFTFDLGPGTDRVDYSRADDQIAAIVAINADTNYVMVNGTGAPDGYRGSEDRVDALIGVEQIAASTGESILDFTTMAQDVRITFQFDENNAELSKDRMVSIVRIANSSGNEIAGIPNFIEYYDLNDDDDIDPFATAAWNRIEGSDYGEVVGYAGSEDLVNLAGVDHRYTFDTLNLRGGANGVSYYELETSITAMIDVIEWDAANPDPFATGVINASITFQDGTGNPLPGGGAHAVSSYTGDNGIAAGSLKIEASQDAEDTLGFVSLSEKVFALGTSPGVIDVAIGNLPAMRLTGFEMLLDAESDDIYDMANLTHVIGDLELIDNPIDDYDTIKVGNDAVGYGAMPADTISLEVLNDEFNFDFDVLDITGVTSGNLLIVGDTNVLRDIAFDDFTIRGTGDDVVVGNLDLIDDISLFDAIVFTNASITSAGSTFELDMDGFQLKDNSSALFTTDAWMLDFSRVTSSAVNASLLDNAAWGGAIIGTAGNDTITGGAGNDYLEGGAGADILDGGTATEVRQIELSGIADLVVDAPVMTLTMGTGGVTLTLNEVAGDPLDINPTDGNLDITAGSGADAFGVALATLVNANLANINAVAGAFTDGVNDVPLMGASYDVNSNLLTFTFKSGADVLVGDAIVATVTDTAGTIAASVDTTVSQGGDGGADTFAYMAASDSTAAAMDQIIGFNINAVGTNDVIDLSFIATVDPGWGGDLYVKLGLVADFAAARDAAAIEFANDAEIFVVSDGTDAWVFVDVPESSSLDSNDMLIKLVGVADVTNFDGDNIIGESSYNTIA